MKECGDGTVMHLFECIIPHWWQLTTFEVRCWMLLLHFGHFKNLLKYCNETNSFTVRVTTSLPSSLSASGICCSVSSFTAIIVVTSVVKSFFFPLHTDLEWTKCETISDAYFFDVVFPYIHVYQA